MREYEQVFKNSKDAQDWMNRLRAEQGGTIRDISMERKEKGYVVKWKTAGCCG